MSDDYNPFEPDETPEQQNARIGRMIRENVDKRLAAERAASATPAATPLADDPYEECARFIEAQLPGHTRSRLAEGLRKLGTDSAKKRGAEIIRRAALQPAAAQPQRESEQPEQAWLDGLGHSPEEIVRGVIAFYLANQRDRAIALVRAALSPQTDSQEPR